MYNLKCSPLSLFIAGTLLASSPLLLQAEEIIYNDTPSMLNKTPEGIYGEFYIHGRDNSLFPATQLSDNKLSFVNGTIEGGVYGGIVISNETVANNSVIFSDGSARGVSGGFSYAGNADNNHVVFSGGTAGAIDGGLSRKGGASNNSVTFSGGSTGDIYGGQSDTSDANMILSGNKVIFTGGTAEWIHGAESFKGQVRNNTVEFSGGSAEIIFGGSGERGDVTGNSIIFSGGTAEELYGGYNDEEGSASGNNIRMSGGTAQQLYGGYSHEGNATDNTITIEGSPQFASNNTFIYGGFSEDSATSGNLFSGNTLNFSAKPIRINTLANFEQYNFTIDPAHANTTTALISAETIKLGADSDAPSKIKVIGIHSGNALNTNDEFILMQANTMTGYGAGETSTAVAQQGISFLYDIETTVDAEDQRVTATILSSNGSETVTDTDSTPDNGAVVGGSTDNNNANSPARVNPQLKALSEGYLAGAMLINRGTDVIAYDAFNAINVQNNQNGLAPFVMLSGGRHRYNSGSHITSNDALFTTGLSYQQNSLTTGIFLEGGRGSYDSYNSFHNAAKVHGDGSTRYFGTGLLGRYDLENGVYTDASIRFGRTRTKFDTADLQNIATGQSAKYNLKSNYFSAHLGAGYILVLNDKNTLDLSSKYLHSSVAGKKANVAGDTIRFNRVDSKRVRTDASLNHTYTESINFNAGLGYEHEFDSKAKTTTHGSYRIDAPKVKGGTGIFSVGATVIPSNYQNFTLDLNTDGYVGKREGVGASIRAGYAF